MIESILSVFSKAPMFSSKQNSSSKGARFEDTLFQQEKINGQTAPKSHDSSVQGYSENNYSGGSYAEAESYEDDSSVEDEGYKDDSSVDAEGYKDDSSVDADDVLVEAGVESKVEEIVDEQTEDESDIENSIAIIAEILNLDKDAVDKLRNSVKGGRELKALAGKLKVIAAELSKGGDSGDLQKLLGSLKKAIMNGDTKNINGEMNKLLDKAQVVQLKEGDLDSSPLEDTDGPSLDDLGEMAKSVKKVVIKTDHAAESKFFHDNYKTKVDAEVKQPKISLPDATQQFSQKEGKSELGSGEAPKFMKKMKSALSMKNGEKTPPVASFEAPANKAQAQTRVSFINKMVSGRFVQQMVEKIQNMVTSRTTVSGSVDFKSLDFGDMKLAAEVTGSKLSIKLSSVGQMLSTEIVNMKDELLSELKSIGFDDVEIDFGNGEQQSGKSPFEDEIQKHLDKDAVKLPGDYLADLGKIDDWLKSFEEVG